MDRTKLETAIERQTFKFLSLIKESASDSVMLWASRNRIDVDVALLQRILDQYKAALESEYLSKVDHLMEGLDKDLVQFTQVENPLPPTDEPKPKRKNSKKSVV